MQAFKITMNNQDQDARFATSAEAQMLVDVLVEEFPTAKIDIVEINQSTQYHVNETGLNEIKEFLAANNKKGGDHFNREMLKAWATEAEFQLSEGNPPTIEIRSFDSLSGATSEYCISEEGLDSEIIEIEE